MNSGKTQTISHHQDCLVNRPQYIQKGFTLVELLVVMVIVSAVTTLLASGLSTTWNNFAKLNSSKLTISSSKLPLSWFSRSINGVILYNPLKSYFTGTQQSITYTTWAAPDTPVGVPTQITWSVNNDGLVYSNSEKDKILVFASQHKLHFEYLENGEWIRRVSNVNGRLPESVRIIDENNNVVVLASPQRPIIADVPEDIKLYGELEF